MLNFVQLPTTTNCHTTTLRRMNLFLRDLHSALDILFDHGSAKSSSFHQLRSPSNSFSHHDRDDGDIPTVSLHTPFEQALARLQLETHRAATGQVGGDDKNKACC